MLKKNRQQKLLNRTKQKKKRKTTTKQKQKYKHVTKNVFMKNKFNEKKLLKLNNDQSLTTKKR